MKCSEYLWARCKMADMFPDFSPERIDGEMSLMMYKNGDFIVNDVTGERMTDVEAGSIMGRNYLKMLDAYKKGKKSLFELLAKGQQISDEEWEKAMQEEAEEEAKEEATEETPAEG